MFRLNQLKKGGQGGSAGYAGTHAEIIYDVTRWDAIYYCEDPNTSNQHSGGDGYPKHPYSPILQAIMLRKEYEQQYQETKAAFIRHGSENAEALFYERFGPTGLLPIFHYSGLHHQLEIVPENELTDHKVIELWVGMCSDFIIESLHQRHSSDITTMSLNEIKVRAMYGEITSSSPNFRGKTRDSADMNYSEELQQRINDAIQIERARLIHEDAEDWRKQVLSEELSLVDDRVFYKLMENQSLLKTFSKDWLKEAIGNLAQSPACFESSLGSRLFKWDCSNFLDEEKIIKLCTQPVTDLFKTTSEEEQNMHFENQAVRLYALCQWVHDDSLMQLIQEKAMALVLARIEKIRKSVNLFSGKLLPDMVNELTQLDHFAKVFAIDLKLKAQFDNMKNEVFKQISAYPYSQHVIAQHYVPAIELLQQLHWFNADIDMNPANKTLALFAAQLTGEIVDKNQTVTGTYLDSYLELSALLKQPVDKEAIKAFVLNNLDVLKHHFLAGNNSGFRKILTFLPLTDENNDLFTIMVSCSEALKSWSAYLEAFKKIMPNQAFSEKQLFILQRNLELCAEKMLNTQLSMHEAFKDSVFVRPAYLNFGYLSERITFCTEIQAMIIPLEVPACILQSLLNYLNQYADQLPSPPERFISQKDSERLQNTLILQVESINQKLSVVHPELATLIERIKANPASGVLLAGSP